MHPGAMQCSVYACPNVCCFINCINAVQEGHSDYDEEDDLLDVFDITEAEPDLLFVNPFGCQVDPMCWRQLQVCLAALHQCLSPETKQALLL